MKPNKATLQAFLDWMVAEQQGPTGWAVTNAALEVIRFAEQQGITLDKTQYERHNRQTGINRLQSADLRDLREAVNGYRTASGQLEAQKQPSAPEHLQGV